MTVRWGPRTVAPLALLLLLLAPAADAGTAAAPDIQDADGDGGLDQLDLQALWIDTNDTQNLTFHVTLGGGLPTAPDGGPATSACPQAGTCGWVSLTYRIIFRVLGPDGKPLPTMADYNRSYVGYRHGPDGDLVSPVGTYDSKDVLTLAGSANVTVSTTELVVRIPRSSPAVNMPVGPTPGSVIDRLYSYDSPQACTPAACAPMLKPVVIATPGVNAVTAVNDWDRAPDVGMANASFPASPPPPAASPSPSGTPTPSTSRSPTPGPAPVPVETESPDPITFTVTTTSTPAASHDSPGSGGAVLACLLVCIAVLVRRRL